MKLQLIICLLLLTGISTFAQTRLQTATGSTGSTTATSFNVVLGTPPQNGNTLIAVISTRSTIAPGVTSISQTGATWVRATNSTGTAGTLTEIWYTTNLLGGQNTITINQNNVFAAAVVMEYSGLLQMSVLDRVASASGSGRNNVTSGTTATTTTANQLWIAGIGLSSSNYNYQNPTNSFSIVTNVSSSNATATNNARVFALERIVTATGTAGTGGVNTGNNNPWAGAVATFRVSPFSGFSPAFVCSGSGATITLSGLGFSTTSAVSINGISASYTIVNNNQVTVTLPANATTGTISITTSEGTFASSNPLIVRTLNNPTATITNTSCPDGNDGAVTLNIPVSVNLNSTLSQQVNLGASLLNGLTAFTLEGWIKTTTYTRSSLFGQDNAIELGFTADGSIELWVEGVSTQLLTTSTAYPRDGNWHHVAAVGNGTNISIYINGVMVASDTHPALTNPTNYGTSAFNTRMGGFVFSDVTPNYFNGQLLKVGFWNRALTPTELVNLATTYIQYTSNSGLIAGYNFFDASGTSLSSSPLGANGTLAGNPSWIDGFTYSWTKNGEGFTSIQKNISSLPVGIYNVTTTFTGCTSTSGSFEVISNGSYSTAASSITGPSTPVCQSTTVEFTLNGGTLGSEASWKWYAGACGTNQITTGITNGGRTLTVSPSTTTTYYARAEGNCNTTDCVSFTVTVIPTGTWLGTTSTDWNDASNWCGGIPSSTTDVVIPTTPMGPHFPVVGAAGAISKSLTIESGASVTMDGAYTFDLYGNWINNGSFTASTSTLNFRYNESISGSENTSIQGSSPTTFHHLVIETGKTLTGSPATMNLTGNFINNGSYTNNGGTVIFNGTISQEINGATTFNNLTINNTAGVFGKTDFTVNGILNLASESPDETKGTIEMTIDYGEYTNIFTPTDSLSSRTTKYWDILSSNTLFMGANATTIGIGDVTGKVKRTTINENVEYSFGNPNTSITFNRNSTGTLPSAILFIITKGSNRGIHSNKTNTVARLHQVIRTGGSAPTSFTLKLHYKDSELNGNSENNLVLWDHHIPYNSANTPHEHGKTSQNTTENWVELSGHGIGYLGSQEVVGGFTKYWMFSNTLIEGVKWLGAFIGQQTIWNNPSNWTSGRIPTSSDNVIIQPTTYAPTIPTSGAVAKTLEIEPGAILNGDDGTLTLNGGIATNGGKSSWINNGTFNAGTSTVTFDYPRRTMDQTATISGTTTFHNLTVADSTSMVLQAGSSTSITNSFSQTGVGKVDARLFNNTVSYTGDDVQSVLYPAISNGYHNLTLSGSGAKTLPASNLSIAGNLVLSAPFSATSNTITFDGLTAQTLSGTSGSALNNLTINNSNGLSLVKNQLIDGLLTFTNGLITTGSNVLTLGCDAGISGESNARYINGKLARQYCGIESRGFPIGKGGVYRPLTIARTTGETGISTIQSEQMEATIPGILPSYTTVFTNRYWNITQSEGSETYTLQLDGTGFTPAGTPVILKGDGSAENTLTSLAVTTPNYTTAAGVSSFSDFTLGSECLPPVITTQPTNQTGCELSSTVTFTIAATPIDGEIFTYSWEENPGSGWTTISNGGVYSGATTATLTLTNPPFSMNGYQYQVVVTRFCGGMETSGTASLTINLQPQGSLTTGETTLCKNDEGFLTWTATEGGAGPYTIVYNDGSGNHTVNDVYSGVPFSVGTLTSTTTFTLVSVYNGTCTRTSGFTTASAEITVNPFVTWNGTTDTDWFTASNWCGGVPTTNDDVLIPTSPTGARFPVIRANGALCQSLIIQSSASVTINGAYTLTASGNLTNNGTLTIDLGTIALTGYLENNSLIETKNSIPDKSPFDGTIEYNGTSPQILINNASYNHLVINNPAGVSLPTATNISADVLTIEENALLIIDTERAMTATTVDNQSGTNGLWIRSAADKASGSLIFNNTSDNPVPATIEKYSKAFKTAEPDASGNFYKWQYFGIPLQGLATASPTFDGSFVRKYNPAGRINVGTMGSPVYRSQWIPLTNDSSLTPFTGYQITQNSARMITFRGNLENSDYLRDANDPLIYYPEAAFPGQYIFANPYTAAIDISQLSFGPATEATVYLYNSGSYGDWSSTEPTTGGNEGETLGENPGQYVAIPKEVATATTPAGLIRQIPSMQGFLVKKLVDDTSDASGFTLEIVYNTVATNNNTLQRTQPLAIDPSVKLSGSRAGAQRRVPLDNSKKELQLPYTLIDVKGRTLGDRLWLFTHATCSNRFDNGWDGEKLSSNRAAPRIFALMPDRDYQVHTTNTIHTTPIGFVPGDDTQYELIISHHDGAAERYPEGIFLEDLTNGSLTDISANNSRYRFTSRETDPVKRFRIRIGGESGINDEAEEVLAYALHNEIVLSNFSSADQLVTLYDAMGRSKLSAVSPKGVRKRMPVQLPAGVYVAQFSSGKSFKLILK